MGIVGARGLHLRTAYSGKGTAETMSELTRRTLAGHMKLGKWLSSHSCDCKPEAIRALLAVTPEEGGAECVFGDIMKKLPKPLQQRIAGMMPAKGASPEDRQQAFDAIASLIQQEGPKAFTGTPRGPCLRHNHTEGCLIFKPTPDGALTVAIAGSTCKAFSSRNQKREYENSEYSVPYHVWVQEVKAWKPMLVILEISPVKRAREMLDRDFKDDYDVHHTEACPTYIGHPAQRLRLITFMFDESRVRFTGSMEEMWDLLRCTMEMSGNAYWLAPKEVCRRDQLARARQQRCHVPTSNGNIPLTSMLNACQTAHWRDYETLRSQRRGLDGSFIADLDQGPAFNSSGPMVPTLVSHGCIVSWQKGLMSSPDHLSVQGESSKYVDSDDVR